MPFRPEGSLLHWLDTCYKNRLLPPHELRFLLKQAASALQHAHNAQIIHLDVKPSNFLIRLREHAVEHPDLLLTDFGISRFSTTTATASQSIRGTPLYMAPEQWTSAPVTASDQYALAIMAYQLLTGIPPFKGNMQQVMYQHLQVSPQPPSVLHSDIPHAVDEVILRALAKQPKDRFASIALFADALAAAWQQTSTLSGHSGDPESFVLTELMLPKSEAFSVFPPAICTSSTTDPTLSVVEKRPAEQDKALIFSSPGGEPSVWPAQASADTITPVPPISQTNKGNPLLPAVIGLCLLLVFASMSVWVYLAHPFVLVPAPTSTASLSTPTPKNTSLPTPTNTPAPPTPTITSVPNYPQLKPFYNGAAMGYTNATITFSLQSEDQQGNVKMQTTFQRTDNQASAIYNCQGQVSQDNQLTLSCTEVGLPNFQLSIHGTIFADGHMEGTEEATDSNDPAYDHLYNWSVS